MSDPIPWTYAMQDNVRLRSALQAVWDECNEFVFFEPVREQVKEALGIREFTASPPEPSIDGSTP
jgi:hypothetical protein